MPNPLFNLDRCVEVAGDDRYGRFLRKLFRWHVYTTVVLQGHKWCVWTCAQWCADMGLTAKQFRLVLERMDAAGLIVREQHRNPLSGLVSLFLRPTEKAYDEMAKGQARKCPKGQARKCPKGQTLIYNPVIEPEKETKSADGFAAANPEEVCFPEKKGYQDEVGNVIEFPKAQGGAAMTTAAEIAAKFAAAKPKPIDTLKPDKVASLIHVWQQSVKEGQVPPAFTKKVLGQFKYLIKKWPAGKAPEILQFVLGHWYEMTEAVETKTSKYNSPSAPDIDYLVKYQHIAVNLFLKAKMKAASSPKPAPKPVVQSIAPEPVKVKDAPATLEDLLAMEAEEELKAAS